MTAIFCCVEVGTIASRQNQIEVEKASQRVNFHCCRFSVNDINMFKEPEILFRA